MHRRKFLQSLLGAGCALTLRRKAEAALAKMKITRVRLYESPLNRPSFNQSFHVITVETDAGITGIGEGGTPDMINQLGALLIGEDPARIDHLWQYMYRAFFYPPGREKNHGLGGLDLALWDIKGKALGVPVWQLLGGQSREHVECYSTGYPSKGNVRDTAKACVGAGFRAFRTGLGEGGAGGDNVGFNSHAAVRRAHEQCKLIREGVGPEGDWAIDFHTKLDFPDAIRLAKLLEDLEPYFCEDLVRSEAPGLYASLRPQVKVPIAVGEHYGGKWDTNELIEKQLIDYTRATIPNVGGLSEYMKIAALCETHYVGLIPHFTGPISEAALVHACAVFSGPCMMEMTGAGTTNIPYLPKHYDFRGGKLWPNERPGLGVEVDTKQLKMLAEVTKHAQPTPLLRRPDGSITNW